MKETDHELGKLKEGLEKLGTGISTGQLKQFDRYISLLIEWNQKMNLTAIIKPEEIIVEHFLDSLSLINIGDMKDVSTLIDVGTGAGFPGVPLKIMMPHIRVVLLDSLRKRTEYLRNLKVELGLDNMEIYHSRAEDSGAKSDMRGQFDIAVSRAVAPLNVLSELCLPFVKDGGVFVAYKGPAAQDELSAARDAIKILGGGIAKINRVDVPYSPKEHNLIIIQKLTQTIKKYPRSPGKIKKSPL